MLSQMQADWDSSWLDSGNQSYLENQFDIFLKNPDSLSPEWRKYFENLPSKQGLNDVSHADIIELFKRLSYQKRSMVANTVNVDNNMALQQAALEKLIAAYRLLGHKASDINPLTAKPVIPTELTPEFYGLDTKLLDVEFNVEDLPGSARRTLRTILQDLQKIYCGTIGAEYMYINDSQERLWVQQNLESALLNLNLASNTQTHILELLVAADGMEKYLGAKYPGAKRFGLEGCDSLIVSLEEMISHASSHGVEEIVIAMAHRGRMNLLVNVLGKMPGELFDQFEEKHNVRFEFGDVKYHLGFASDLKTEYGHIHVSLAVNPSHLEIVNPVVCGSVRARQDRRGENGIAKVMGVVLHGDAAFSGQGVVMENLNMSETRGYGTGGSLHIIINNQIGFTTSDPRDARSTLYCSDLGKMLAAPIIHVNADDPEAVYAISRLAIQYRMKFKRDIIIDLVGYRRLGHNEADEPSVTQPIMYKEIRAHSVARKIYADKLIAANVITQSQVDQMIDSYRNLLDQRDTAVVKRLAARDWKSAFASDWTPYGTGDWRTSVSTKVPVDTLKKLATSRDTVPDGFTLDPRVEKIIEARRVMTDTGLNIDWGYAETLAYASLVNDGYGVRLSGQDCSRSTFFHRHARWHDHNNGDTYVSLAHLNEKQGKFMVFDSLLSEAGVLGFEYGYSTSEPRTLTIWEAQYGDFANGAQVIIDQFISSGELKWGRLSGLVMLLPHGYEGQGPEHSSARIERYLQLCAQHNMQVCIPSTPAQIYHLLRRQMLHTLRKPLIVITPKSMLRNKNAVSTLDDLANGEFKLIVAEPRSNYDSVDRVILCSGKIYYELMAAMSGTKKENIAFIRVEQVYPFPEQELMDELAKYKRAEQVVWCQEEPQNQGVWYSMQHHFNKSLAAWQKLNYVGRAASASPAVGYLFLHEQQQHDLINIALGNSQSSIN